MSCVQNRLPTCPSCKRLLSKDYLGTFCYHCENVEQIAEYIKLDGTQCIDCGIERPPMMIRDFGGERCVRCQEKYDAFHKRRRERIYKKLTEKGYL